MLTQFSFIWLVPNDNRWYDSDYEDCNFKREEELFSTSSQERKVEPHGVWKDVDDLKMRTK